jgi:hypothetical protein
MDRNALKQEALELLLNSIDIVLDILLIIEEQYKDCGDVFYSYGEYITEKITYENHLSILINKQKKLENGIS